MPMLTQTLEKEAENHSSQLPGPEEIHVLAVRVARSLSLPPSIDQDDFTQDIEFKYWRISQKQRVDFPKTYVWRIGMSLAASAHRSYKPTYSLLTNEDGELLQGSALLAERDALALFEEEMQVIERYRQLAPAVLALPKVQKRAILCFLHEKLDGDAALARAFREYGIDITTYYWPVDKRAKQRLQASCGPALVKIAHLMHVEMECRKKRRCA